MTRRKFIQAMMGAWSAIMVGAGWLAKKAAPRRFTRAVPLGKYPGRVVPLTDISRRSRWSG